VSIWKEQETRACGPDCLAHRLSFVRSEIVENDDVVGLESWDQELLDIGAKALAVDRTVEQARGLDAIVAQGGEKDRGLPRPMRDLVDEPLAARRPTVKPRHVGLGPGLVEKQQTRGIRALLIGAPSPPMTAYVRAVALARDERLFLSVTPIRRKNRLIIEVSVLTPRSVKSRSQSVCSVTSGFSARRTSRNSRLRLQLHPLIAAHSRRPARAGPLKALNPLDRRRQAHPKPRRRPQPAHLSANHRVNHTIPQILRIGSSHPCWPPSPTRRLNQNQPDSGIPIDSK
jgi:hypothetical protein